MEIATAQILIDDIDDDLMDRLVRRAARNGRSVEAEVLVILADVLTHEDRQE